MRVLIEFDLSGKTDRNQLLMEIKAALPFLLCGRHYSLSLFQDHQLSVIDYVWEHRFEGEFDYPHYLGLPVELSALLSSDFVDAIQEAMNSSGLSKAEFVRHCLKYEGCV